MIYVCNELEHWTTVQYESRFMSQIAYVPENVRAHILKKARPMSRYQSLTGWLLLLYAYEKEYGRSLPPVQFLPGGKPGFVQDTDGYFSLSHSGNMACCVLTDVPCGVDIQEVRSVSPGLIARCCNDREELQIQDAADGERERLFALLWSRKEAMGKLNGAGIAQDLKSLGWSKDFDSSDFGGFSCMITEHIALALCCKGEKKPNLEQLTILSLSSLFRKDSV